MIITGAEQAVGIDKSIQDDLGQCLGLAVGELRDHLPLFVYADFLEGSGTEPVLNVTDDP